MTHVHIHCTKNISVPEYVSLMAAVGWGAITDYDATSVSRSIDSYPFVAHARTTDGALVGYVSAFSDGAFSTFIGEVLVHPQLQGQGVGFMYIFFADMFRFPPKSVHVSCYGTK